MTAAPITNRRMFALLAVSAILGFAASADAGQGQPRPRVEAWPAMAGVETAALLVAAQELPLSDHAIDDQPYCAPDREIAATLMHDFNESLVETAGHEGLATALWGSEQMGTWTLVAQREDASSCIIASGIGFDPAAGAETFYRVAGLR